MKNGRQFVKWLLELAGTAKTDIEQTILNNYVGRTITRHSEVINLVNLLVRKESKEDN